MPPSGFSQSAVRGALQFIRDCYEDLLREVQSEKHADYESAIKFEIAQIESALSRLHINKDGELVERG